MILAIIILIFTIICILSIYLFIYKEKFTQNNKLEFIHIPKNAGSSIETLGNKHNINWGYFVKNIEVYKNTQCDQYKWHSPYIVKKPDTDYFVLIRNPYDRLISTFYYQFDITKDESQEIHIKKFKQWFSNIQKIYRNDTHYYNCHLLPQSNYVYDENNNKVIQHVIYMDKNLNNNLDKLFKQYNLNIDIKLLNNDNNTYYKRVFNKYDLDQDTLDKIYEMYKVDFDNFNFDRIIKDSFDNTNRITVVTGFWEVNNNKKHHIEHYLPLIEKTAQKYNNCDIICYYDNEKYLNLFMDNLNDSNNIIPINKQISELPTYYNSNKMLQLCKEQSPEILKLSGSEKGAVHYNRELLGSGEDAYKKIITIWTSKLFLVKECINKNYFNNEIIAWADITLRRWNFNFKNIHNDTNKIYLPRSVMLYMNEKLPTGAGFIYGKKSLLLNYINDYIQIYNNNNDKYCHDEETLLFKLYDKYKNDIIQINL